MSSNLNILLNEFKEEVDNLANDFFEKSSEYLNKGILGYALFKHDSVSVDNALDDYNKLIKAFSILSSTTIKKYTKKKREDTMLDRNNTLKNISYTKNEAQKLAKSIIDNDKKLFYKTLTPILENNRLVDRYTKEIFGKSIKK